MRTFAVVLSLAALAGCQAPPASGPQRIVSLSPAITETLFALGAGDRVVGVTDYCDFPAEVASRVRAGSMLQPGYEQIARLHPTLIVGEQIRNAPTDRLGAIAPTKVIPWLTLDDVTASTVEIGRLVGREQAAQALAARLRARLSAKAPPTAPRVLLVVAGPPGAFSEVWFVKRNSLHGTVLEAAGGRNAVDEDVSGSPVLTLERLVAIDPDVVLLLISGAEPSPVIRQQYLDAWKALPLKAVKAGNVRIVTGPEVQSTGPRILGMADRLAEILRGLRSTP